MIAAVKNTPRPPAAVTARNPLRRTRTSDGLATDEWPLISRLRVNALIVGAASRTVDTSSMLGLAREQIAVQRGGRSLRLPTANCPPVLVLHDVDHLTLDEQCRLLAWLDDHLSVQVISTCRGPLTPLIDAGAFLANLYYRLNTVLLTVD